MFHLILQNHSMTSMDNLYKGKTNTHKISLHSPNLSLDSLFMDKLNMFSNHNHMDKMHIYKTNKGKIIILGSPG